MAGSGEERSREASTVGAGRRGGGLPLLREAHKAFRVRPRVGLRATGTRPVAPVGAVGPRVTGPEAATACPTVRPVPPAGLSAGRLLKARQKLSWKPRVAFDVSLRGRRGPGGGVLGGRGGRGGPGTEGPGLPLTHALPRRSWC